MSAYSVGNCYAWKLFRFFFGSVTWNNVGKNVGNFGSFLWFASPTAALVENGFDQTLRFIKNFSFSFGRTIPSAAPWSRTLCGLARSFFWPYLRLSAITRAMILFEEYHARFLLSYKICFLCGIKFLAKTHCNIKGQNLFLYTANTAKN